MKTIIYREIRWYKCVLEIHLLFLLGYNWYFVLQMIGGNPETAGFIFLSVTLPLFVEHHGIIVFVFLQDHQFAVFMAHMPALKIVLDGLQRRPSAQATPLCDLIVRSWRNRQMDPSAFPQSEGDQLQQPVSMEISLMCPVFHTRMQVPGRIVGCPHVDAFDMEAYLHREALWPRLVCPICG